MTLGTITLDGPKYVGNRRVYDAKVAISSHPAGGQAITPADLGLGHIDDILLKSPVTSTGFLVHYDPDNLKIKCLQPGGHITEIFPDIEGGESADQTSDSATAPVNSTYVMGLSDANATTSDNLAHSAGKSTGLTNPSDTSESPGNGPAGRNVVVVQKNNDAGSITFTAANIIVTGTDQFGNAQTETIAIDTGAVAAANFRWKKGTKVFATVTNVRLTAAQPANAQISIGLGTIIGLRGKITGESDIKAVEKAGAAVSSATYVGSATTHSVDMGADIDTDATGDIEIRISYLSSSAVEVPDATDVGTVYLRVEGN